MVLSGDSIGGNGQKYITLDLSVVCLVSGLLGGDGVPRMFCLPSDKFELARGRAFRYNNIRLGCGDYRGVSFCGGEGTLRGVVHPHRCFSDHGVCGSTSFVLSVKRKSDFTSVCKRGQFG